MDDIPKTPVTSEDEVQLIDYLIILAKHSHLIIFSSAAVGILTFLILFLLPNKYTSTARIMPPQQNTTLISQVLDNLSISSDPGKTSFGMGLSSLLGTKSPGDMMVAILEGPTIADAIIERFNLKEVYEKKYIEEVRKSLFSRVKLTSGKKEYIISIEVTDKDPKRSAEMANAFGEELDKLITSISQRDANNQLNFLDQERNKALILLSQYEESLRHFSEKNSLIQVDAQARGIIEYIANLRAMIDTKEVQIKVLLNQATLYNSDVIKLQTELKGLKEKLIAAESQFERSCVGDFCIAAGKLPRITLEYFRLYREAKYQEKLFELFSKLYELAKLDVVKNVPVIQFVDYAKIPEKRSNKRLVSAILAAGGFFFMIIIAVFVYEYIEGLSKKEGDNERINVLKSYIKPWLSPIIRVWHLIRKP